MFQVEAEADNRFSLFQHKGAGCGFFSLKTFQSKPIFPSWTLTIFSSDISTKIKATGNASCNSEILILNL